MRAGEVVAEILKREGVDEVFCFPSNPLIDAVAAVGIRPIVGREERVVINMADAYARVSRGERVGVCMVQAGPGAEHAFGGVAQAFADSVPILLLTGGAARAGLGLRSGFDSVAGFRPVTKWAERFTTADVVASHLQRAFAKLRNGRPGPVLLEMPADVVDEEAVGEVHYTSPVAVRGQADPAAVAEAVDLLLAAERPIIHAGQGVLRARATAELVEFAEIAGAPVMTSYIGKSAFPEDHQLAIGAGGAAVSPGISHLLPQADLVFSVGSSLLSTLGANAMPAGARLIQATADPDDLAMEYPIACGLVGDARLVLEQLASELRRRTQPADAAWQGDAAGRVSETRREAAERWDPLLSSNETPINPYRVMGDLMRTLDPRETIITHDSGYPRDHLAPMYVSRVPGEYLGWGNTTPLGSSLGLALGAKIAAPEKVVVNVMGDAAFGQSGLDVETAVRYGLGVLTVLLNNSEMGNYEKMQPVAQERYGIKRLTGDYAPIARALGAEAERVDTPEEIVPALQRALRIVREGRPAVVEVITRPESLVLKL